MLRWGLASRKIPGIIACKRNRILGVQPRSGEATAGLTGSSGAGVHLQSYPVSRPRAHSCYPALTSGPLPAGPREGSVTMAEGIPLISGERQDAGPSSSWELSGLVPEKGQMAQHLLGPWRGVWVLQLYMWGK